METAHGTVSRQEMKQTTSSEDIIMERAACIYLSRLSRWSTVASTGVPHRAIPAEASTLEQRVTRRNNQTLTITSRRTKMMRKRDIMLVPMFEYLLRHMSISISIGLTKGK
jgi:hypothetical protein